MLFLLLLYLASQSWAKDVPHDTNYRLQNISSCPETGYFFRREPSVNTLLGHCYLCFCQNDRTAVCWRRDNKKCDVQHYKHNTTVVKKENRVRRSPLGLGDIFFKDAAREVFNKKEPEVCKPYESSFSEGCPPVDWCLGCTVCDCDANGHWDCHILSFCDDDDKRKKQVKKGNKKIPMSYAKPKRQSTAKMAKTTKKTPSAQREECSCILTNSQRKKCYTQSGKSQECINKKAKNARNRVMNGSEAKISEEIVKTMKTVMEDMWNKRVTDALPNIINIIQKRSSPGNNNNKKNVKPKPKPRPKPKLKPKGRGHVFNRSLFVRKKQIEDRKKEMLRKKAQEKKEQQRKAANATKNTKRNKPANNNKNRAKREINLNNSTVITKFDSDAVPNLANTEPLAEQLNTVEPTNNNDSEEDDLNRVANKYPLNYLGPDTAVNSADTQTTVEEINTTQSSQLITSLSSVENNSVIDVVKESVVAPSAYNSERKIKVNRKDIERKIDRTTKKYSLMRMINTNHYKTKNGKTIKHPDNTQISLSSKIESLRNVLKRLLSEFHNNNSVTNSYKNKKNYALKYLKRFFNKIFSKNSNKTLQRLKSNNHTIQILCESFGPCNLNRRNKNIVMKKIKDLNNETIQILKSLKIIKGLLRLIDIPDERMATHNNTTSDLKTDIHKLNFILKNLNNDNIINLSETQRVQINYVKSNAKVFTQSVARFTKILNEIIDLISLKGNKEKPQTWYSVAKSKHNINKSTKLDTINKFKKLLYNYNTIHNIFMRKIIQMFNSLQNNTDVGKLNFETENHSRNVSKNLNKLKHLASVLNPERRQKRNAGQDNTMEYLLLLMEYMLQQKNQLDKPPVLDGIDFLIEAIKNAPDIKSIKNKVLNYDSRKTSVFKSAESNYSASKEDNAIDTLKENEDAIASIIDGNVKQLSTEQVSVEGENLRNDDTKSENKLDAKTDPVNRDAVNVRTSSKQSNENVIINVKSTEKPNTVYMGEDDVLADFDNRLEKTSGEYSRKNNLYKADYEDENNLDDTTQVTIKPNENESATVTEQPTESPVISTESPDKSVGIKMETSNKIIKKFNEIHENIVEFQDGNNNNASDEKSSDTITKSPEKTDRQEKKFKTDLSDVSQEVSEEKLKNHSKKEDVLKKKEEDLMNSLDYGTDNVVDPAKDDNDDKFLNDYFVD
ncbi:protein dopey homolog PFC0245c-like [Amyelois transitella]|uniref:protein dopey homolog PFC0245c-like n=1 Tax=Amyelois transitella TaxID=680683 RepID=UPI00298F977B|nr:protein dopey homolog PFC0245c-like [Amyelois transitella]